MSFLKSAFAVALSTICIAITGAAQQPINIALTAVSGGAAVSTVRQGNLVSLTATVTAANGSAIFPGQVKFCEVQPAPRRCTDVLALATAQVNTSGAAIYKFLPGAGTHTYQAIFLGQHSAATSTSATYPLVVIPYVPTTTTLDWTGGAPGRYTLTSTVSGPGYMSPPTGNVTLTDTHNGNYVLSNLPLTPTAPNSGLDFDDVPVPTEQAFYQMLRLAAADFNGDGIPDIFWTPACIPTLGPGATFFDILLGVGDGSFTAKPTVPVYSICSVIIPAPNCGICKASAVISDFNGDGVPDVATLSAPDLNNTAIIETFLGKGDGTFTPGQVINNAGAPAGSLSSIVTGDFNGDGIMDMVGPSLDFTGLSTYFGKGDGTFTVGPLWQAGVYPAPLVSADLNNDGILDLVVLDQGTSATPASLQVYLGNGDGTFRAAFQFHITGPGSVFAADFNNDGNLDLVVGFVGGAALYIGNGDGTFQQPTVPANFAPELVADVNNDGIPDLILQDGNNLRYSYCYILLGNGDGTFQPGQDIPTVVQEPTPFAVADFNGDGYPDIAAGTSNINADLFLGVNLSQFSDQTATAVANNVFVLGSFNHIIDATYPGDSNYRPSSNSLSLLAVQQPTTLSFTSNPSAIHYGQQVVFSASVTPPTAQNQTATGTVSFASGANGTVPLGTAPVSGGVASLNVTSIPVGTDTLVANYSGDQNFLPSGNSVTEVVTGYASTTTLTASPNPAGLGQSVALIATPAGVGTTIVPTGSVAFFDGTTKIASATVNPSGQAIANVTTLSLGTHSLTAVYSSDAAFFASTSAPYSETIIQPDFSIALATPNVTLARYQHTTVTLTLASIGAFTDKLTLACNNPPKFLTCTFTPNPASLTGDGSTTVSLTLDTDSILGNGPLAASLPPSRRPSRASLALLLCPLSLFTLLAAGRKRPRGILSLLLLAVLALPIPLTLGACGSSVITPVPATTPGTYTIPITATGASTSLTRTASLTLTVTP